MSTHLEQQEQTRMMYRMTLRVDSIRTIPTVILFGIFIIIATKSRGISWVERVAGKREIITTENILVGKPEGKDPCGRPRRRWTCKIEWTLKIDGVKDGTDLIGLGYGPVTGLCEHGNGSSVSIKSEKFLAG
jgi:hypothetical protein